MKIRKENLKYALEHLKKYGDTSLFPVPFEYALIDERTIEWMSRQEAESWVPNEAIKCLSAKELKGFRVATILDPVDTIFYTALIVQEGEEMEKKRIPISDEIVFSQRFKKDDEKLTIFNPEVNYARFKEKSVELAQWHGYILKIDIADFFSRIYLHDIERAISDCLGRDYERAISNFLKNLNSLETVGVLPIGTQASRYISNIVLNDFDFLLKAEGVIFCRFVDDIHIFGDTKEDLYKSMYIATSILNDRYHLSLQTEKTIILDGASYAARCEKGSDENMEMISRIYKQILADGMANGEYEEIDFDELDEETQKEIEESHITDMLEDELNKYPLNYSHIRRILAFNSQIKSVYVIEVVHKNLDRLFPVVDYAMKYLQGIADLIEDSERVKVKNILLDMLINSKHLSHIPFYKIWIIDTLKFYADIFEEKEKESIIRLYEEQDPLSRKFIILLIGALKCTYWFRANKGEFLSLTGPQRRAFIKGLSDCGLPDSERKPFLRTIKAHVNEKDKYILDLLTY